MAKAKITHNFSEKHVFKKGQKLHLDDVYHIQGLGYATVGHWWEHDGEYEDDDNIIITKDIEIQITIKVDRHGEHER